MVYIHNTNGDIIRRSKNLQGIRRFASQEGIERVEIRRFADGEGLLTVHFCGAHTDVNFASFSILQGFVRQWRNAHGAPLLVDGIPSGIVTTKNPALEARS